MKIPTILFSIAVITGFAIPDDPAIHSTEIYSVPEINLHDLKKSRILQVKASSQLNHQDSAGKLMQYSANNVLDSSDDAWVEGVPGDGINEKIEFELPGSSFPRVIGILNGYTKSSKTWRENLRIETILFSINQNTVATLKLKDTWKMQYFYLPDTICNNFPNNKNKTTLITLKILGVYRGLKYQDAAISEVSFFEKKNVLISTPDSISDLKTGTVITAIIVMALLLSVISFYIIKKRNNVSQIQKRNRAKDKILHTLQAICDLIYNQFEKEVLAYCDSQEIECEKNRHIFTVLKFAQQHPSTQNICNYDILHEIRQFRNRIAHPSNEYHHESLETLLHYESVICREYDKIKNALRMNNNVNTTELYSRK